LTNDQRNQFDWFSKKVIVAFDSFTDGCFDLQESIRFIDEAQTEFEKLKVMMGYYETIKS